MAIDFSGPAQIILPKCGVWKLAKCSLPFRMMMKSSTLDLVRTNLIASVEVRKSVRIWDARTGKMLQQIQDPATGFETLCFSPDGQHLAVTGNDQCVRLWDLRSRRFITPPLRHGGNPNQVAFSPDGRVVMTYGLAGFVKLWSQYLKDLAVPVMDPNQGGIAEASFSPSGSSIVAGTKNGAVVVYDAETGEPACIPWWHPKGAYGVQFSPTSERPPF
jgi:WD40 repeat protein